jgi:hypothetical protein
MSDRPESTGDGATPPPEGRDPRPTPAAEGPPPVDNPPAASAAADDSPPEKNSGGPAEGGTAPGSKSQEAATPSSSSSPAPVSDAPVSEAPAADAPKKARKPRRGRGKGGSREGRSGGRGRGRSAEKAAPGSAEAPAGEGEGQGRAPRRIASPKVERDRALAEIEELCERASEVARRLFLAKPYSRDVTKTLPGCDLDIKIDFRGRPAETRAQAKELVERLETHIDDAILGLAAFRPGAVYSFFDDSSEGSQCRPVDPREIFCGYNETGLPQWQPMLSWAVDTGFHRVDELVKERGAPVVALMNREQLVGKRLESFGEKDRAYDLRGQVAIGYYGEGDDPARRFAVTLQVLISHTRGRSVRLGLNVLGRLPEGGAAHELLGSNAPWSFVDLHRQAQRRLAAVNQELKRKPAGERRALAEAEAEQLLADLAQGGARRARRANWRTEHAQERARDKSRPTGMARNDVESVRPERVFRDAQDSTTIVLGAKGRVHVFTPEGLHVTSLHLDRAALDQRMQRRRWQAMPADDFTAALSAIRARFEPTT